MLKLLEVRPGENGILEEETVSKTHSNISHATTSNTFHLDRKSSQVLHSSPSHKNASRGNNSSETKQILNKDISFEPKVVDLEEIENQIQESLRFVIEFLFGCILLYSRKKKKEYKNLSFLFSPCKFIFYIYLTEAILMGIYNLFS